MVALFSLVACHYDDTVIGFCAPAHCKLYLGDYAICYKVMRPGLELDTLLGYVI